MERWNAETVRGRLGGRSQVVEKLQRGERKPKKDPFKKNMFGGEEPISSSKQHMYYKIERKEWALRQPHLGKRKG